MDKILLLTVPRPSSAAGKRLARRRCCPCPPQTHPTRHRPGFLPRCGLRGCMSGDARADRALEAPHSPLTRAPIATPLRWRPSEGLSQRPVRRAVRSVVPLELPGALALLQVRPPSHSCPRGLPACAAWRPTRSSKCQGLCRLGAGGFLGPRGAPISIPRALRGVGQGLSLRQIRREAVRWASEGRRHTHEATLRSRTRYSHLTMRRSVALLESLWKLADFLRIVLRSTRTDPGASSIPMQSSPRSTSVPRHDLIMSS